MLLGSTLYELKCMTTKSCVSDTCHNCIMVNQYETIWTKVDEDYLTCKFNYGIWLAHTINRKSRGGQAYRSLD